MNQTLKNRIFKHLRSFFRDPANGQLLGVCAGLAGACRLNPLTIRIVAVALLLSFPIPAALAYLVLAAILPDAPPARVRNYQAPLFASAEDSHSGVNR